MTDSGCAAKLRAEIERLRAERDEMRAALGSAGYARALKECDDLRAEIERLTANNDRLQAALKPFADAAAEAEGENNTEPLWESDAGAHITVWYLRNARDVLAGKP